MARRSKEDLIAEFHQRYDATETLLHCMEPLLGRDHFVRFLSGFISRDRILQCVSEGTATASEILAGTEECLNDLLASLQDALEDQPKEVNQVLALYRERTGHNLFDQLGDPRKFAKAIVRRGKIETETEYYLLEEQLNNVDQTVFKGRQLIKANEILYQYETRMGE